MKFKLVSFVESGGKRYANIPDGAHCENLVMFRGGVSAEEYDSETIPPQLALMAAMNKWYAAVGNDYHKFVIKNGGIVILVDQKPDVVLRKPYGRAYEAVQTQSEIAGNSGPVAFEGTGK